MSGVFWYLFIKLFCRQRKYIISQLRKIQEADLNDTLKVQDIAMKFCKQQELRKSVSEITKIINNGNIDDYVQ
jgi:hypothetical protein